MSLLLSRMNSQTISNILAGIVSVLLFALIGVVLLTNSSARRNADLRTGDSTQVTDDVRVLSVNTIAVTPGDSYQVKRRFSGAIQSKRAVDLGFSSAGILNTIKVRPGDSVKAGEALATLQSGVSLTAPFEGVVASLNVTAGAQISPGRPVIRLLDPKQLEIQIGVPLELGATLKKGDEYQLAVGSEIYQAPVSGVSPEVSPGSRSRTIFFDLPQAAGDKHLPGEIARLELWQSIQQKGAWVPLSSLSRETRGLWSVYAIFADESNVPRIQRLFVEVVQVEDDQAWVTGLVGEPIEIIANGIHRVVPGQEVRPKPIVGNLE